MTVQYPRVAMYFFFVAMDRRDGVIIYKARLECIKFFLLKLKMTFLLNSNILSLLQLNLRRLLIPDYIERSFDELIFGFLEVKL